MKLFQVGRWPSKEPRIGLAQRAKIQVPVVSIRSACTRMSGWLAGLHHGGVFENCSSQKE